MILHVLHIDPLRPPLRYPQVIMHIPDDYPHQRSHPHLEPGPHTICLIRTSGQAREEDAANVYGYTGTLRANSQATCGQAREEDAARVYGYTGILRANYQEMSGQPGAGEEDAASVYIGTP